MSVERVALGVVPAAGRGLRAYPKTTRVPKVLLEVGGQPLVQRNLQILRDALGIHEAIVIVGHLGDQVRDFLGDGAKLDMRLRYVECPDPDVGLAAGLALCRDQVNEPFVTILGDELYLDSNHEGLLERLSGAEAVCCVVETDDLQRIRKNYSARIEEGRIVAVEEKPPPAPGVYLGCGSYFFRPSIFGAIERTPRSPRSGRVELTDAIGTLIAEGELVRPCFLSGEYVNVNSVEDQNSANYLVRSQEFSSYRVSVVIPAWNEVESIGYVIRDFEPHVDEIVVMDNQSEDGTAELAEQLGARVVSRPLRGYGEALRAGIDEARGDIIVLVEADHSFRSKDLGKLLEYMKDADMVMGTRTTRQVIEQGTNMHGLVRIANLAVGKLIEALWWSQEPRFTDVGCTYRAIWRDVYAGIRERLEGVGPEFAPEMMIEVLRNHRRVIEIPVTYYPRLAGTSKHSDSYLRLAQTALRMLRLIFRKRLLGIWGASGSD